MTSTIVKYGLMNIATGKIVGYETEYLDGDCSVGIAHSLSVYEDNEWLVDTPEHAEYVRQVSAKKYNADYDTPENEFKPEELKVVKVTKVVTIEEVVVNIPSFREMMEYKHGKGGTYEDAHHLNFVLSMKAKRDADVHYNLYDLKSWKREQGNAK